MFALVANVIQFFIYTVSSVFLIASFIGQLIFTTLTTLSSALITIFESIFLFVGIICEDNAGVVTEEIPNFFDNIVTTTTDQLRQINDVLYTILDYTSFQLDSVLNQVLWFFNAFGTIIGEVLYLFKKTFIVIGDGIWLILTFIPVQVPLILNSLSSYIFDYIKTLVIKCYNRLLKVTNFLTDVPLQSFAGITCAIIIVRLYVNYREEIHSKATELYWICIRRTLYLYYVLYNYLTNSEARMIAEMSPNQQVRLVDSDVVNENDASDTLCVVCQERQKCILTLPCRHVCLCSDCCTRLYGYQRNCPICRTFIYHSVNVYL